MLHYSHMATEKHSHIVALDFDSQHIFVTLCNHESESSQNIVPLARASKYPHNGMRRGVPIDKNELTSVVRDAFQSITQQIGYIPPILIGLHPSIMTVNQLTVSHELTASPDDARKVVESDRDSLFDEMKLVYTRKNPNCTLLHMIPIMLGINNETLAPGEDITNYSAWRIGLRALCIGTHNAYVEDCLAVVHAENTEVYDTAFTPLVVAYNITERRNRMIGSCVVYIASETTTVIVFNEDAVTVCQTFPFGISDIASDVALGYSVDLTTALLYLSEPHTLTEKNNSNKRLHDVVFARYTSMAGHIADAISKQGSGILPGGVTILSHIPELPGLEEVVRNKVKLPTRTWSGDVPTVNARRKTRDYGIIGAFSIGVVYAKQNTILFDKARIVKNYIRDVKNSVLHWVQSNLGF